MHASVDVEDLRINATTTTTTTHTHLLLLRQSQGFATQEKEEEDTKLVITSDYPCINISTKTLVAPQRRTTCMPSSFTMKKFRGNVIDNNNNNNYTPHPLSYVCACVEIDVA